MNHQKNAEKISFWQSPSWKMLLDMSHQAEKVLIYQHGDRDILIELRSIGLGQIAAFTLGLDPSIFGEDFIRKVGEFLIPHAPLYYQIEYLYGMRDIHPQSLAPYRHFLEPYTRMIDLTQSEEDILRGMHEKGRYNIRLAEKHGVMVSWVEPTPESLDIWMDLLQDTTSRDSFAHNSRAYYETFLSEEVQSEKTETRLAFAKHEDRVIAAGIWVYHEDTAIYYYGASSSDAMSRKHMAPYLLQWFALLEGKRRGCTTYDFLGIARPGESESHLAGVSGFKEKFGGTVVELGPKYLIPLSWKYRVFSLIRRIKKSL